jgi:hypothetical protein
MSNGMGNPYEPGHFDQFRDSKSKRPDDTLYRPLPKPDYAPELRELRTLLEEMKGQFHLLMQDFVKKNVFFSKRPAYVEPPFFSTPTVKVIQTSLAVAVAFSDVWSIPISGRHAVILTAVGMDYDTLAAVNNRSIIWRYQFLGSTVQLFDDNSTAPAGAVSFEQGVFSIPLGTFAAPLLLHPIAVSTRLKTEAPTLFKLQAQNTGAGGVGAVVVNVITAFYQYRYDHSDEFEQSEYMK